MRMLQMGARFESQSEHEAYESLEERGWENWEMGDAGLSCMKELFKKVSESSCNLFPAGVEMDNELIGYSPEWDA